MATQIYEYFLTVAAEIELVWAERFSYMSCFFLCSRYLPLLDISISVYREIVLSPICSPVMLIWT